MPSVMEGLALDLCRFSLPAMTRQLILKKPAPACVWEVGTVTPMMASPPDTEKMRICWPSVSSVAAGSLYHGLELKLLSTPTWPQVRASRASVGIFTVPVSCTQMSAVRSME